MIRKILLALLIISGLLAIWYRELLSYGWMQAKGQLHILSSTRPVDEVLSDPAFPDSLKRKIELIQQIKRYAIDSIGLNSSANYTTFFDQQGQPILWVVVAAEKYRLTAKEWQFPLIGSFAYKGFFDHDRAERELAELNQQGYDTRLNEVSAWSTLGFFKDPILSSMLARQEGQLAELIIHELTHGTLFIKNNLEYNENLADFVGEYGALRFLAYKYGINSVPYQTYLANKEYGDLYDRHVLSGTQKLDSLYATYNAQTPSRVKETKKWRLIEQIVETVDTLRLANDSKTRQGQQPIAKKRRMTMRNLPNNAYFVGYKTYRQQQNRFRTEFEQKFSSNFNQYLSYLKKTYPSL